MLRRFAQIAVVILGMTPLASAQVIRATESGKNCVAFPTQPGTYAVLYRSSDMVKWWPVGMTRSSPFGDVRVVKDTVQPAKKAFYEVRFAPLHLPFDTDGDGADDFTELRSGAWLNPALPVAAESGGHTLASQEVYDRMAKRDNFPGAQNVREVKFLITDVRTNPRLYFLNVNQHQFHYDFARNAIGLHANLNYWTGLSVFNAQTYFTSARSNLAGSLVYHENYIGPDGKRGIFTLEFWPTDPVEFKYIEVAYEMVAANAPFIDRLVYHAPSETQRQVQIDQAAEFANSAVRSIDTDDLFSSTDYTPMNQQSAYGKLTLADGVDTLSARDIVIFRNLPNDLTKVAGIITEVPQTPLSHVNLKARQNNTPNAYIANAGTHPDIAPFLGENVFYEVRPDGFEIRLATQDEVDEFFESIRPTEPSFPRRNLAIQDIRPLGGIRFAQTDAFGGKTTNLAELQRILPRNTPNGFGVPFYYYDEFMKHNGFYDEARLMMADPEFQSDPAVRKDRLKAFRTAMKKSSTMPAWMFDDLTRLQGLFPPAVTPRLRSSANAEDSVEFNGAGLYDSYTHKEDEGHISKSVLQVWASLWNYRAWEEREFYRIDHLASAMGILVHPNFKNEQANGVAVARNIFDPNWEGYYINVQIGEDLVTNPDADSTPEEMLVASLATSEYEIQYIRSSNQLPAGERVLTRAQVLDLVSKMRLLNSYFDSLYPGFDPNFAMEIEFKITATGDLVIKQARPWVD
ncbi:MAG: PEP/pyruvate-binding domain-containing protein [Verrucomicrobiaceae bacterium]